jgi:hypothetical protein
MWWNFPQKTFSQIFLFYFLTSSECNKIAQKKKKEHKFFQIKEHSKYIWSSIKKNPQRFLVWLTHGPIQVLPMKVYISMLQWP